MSSYDDLIPGPAPSRRISAYDDLLPGGAPAAAVRPAEDVRLSGDEAATVSRVSRAVRRINQEIVASQPARATMSRRGGVAIAPADLSLKEPPQREADWGDVAESLPKQLVGSTVSALANLARMKATESAVQREEAATPAAADPSGWGALVKPKAVTRQIEKLAADRTAIADAVASANQAKDYLVDETPADMTTGQKAVSSLVSSAPPTALGIATGILTRNPAAAMAIAGGGGSAIQAGSTYGEALEHGADHRQASIASTIDAAIEGLDALPVGVALKPGSSFLKRLPKTMLVESGTEAGQQALQDLRAMAMENPELTLGEVWENVKVAMLAGAGGGAVYGGIGAAANKARETDLARKARAAAEPGNALAAAIEGDVADTTLPPAAGMAPTAVAAGPAPTRAEIVEVPAPVVAPAIMPAPAAAKPEVAGYDDLVPQAVGPVKVEDLPASTDVHELMRIMATNSGHLERGGLAAGSQSQVPIKGAKSQAEMNEEGTGRTVWVGQPPWASGLGMSVKQIETAVDKAIRGKHLGKKQRTVVEAMLQELHDMRTEIDQTPAPQAWGTLTQEQKDAELDQIFGEDSRQADAGQAAGSAPRGAGAVAPGVGQAEAGRAAEAGVAGAGTRAELTLTGQTPAEIAAAERARAEAEAQRAADEKAAEDKRKADAQRDDFDLTGSDRQADQNTDQDDIFDEPGSRGMPAAAAGTLPAAAAHGTVPPGTQSVGKDRARPDAIRAAMEQLFGAPINEKHQGRKNLGLYRTTPETIRLRNRNDLRTAAHEVGHHISNRNQAFRAVMKQHAAELIAIMPAAYKAQIAAGKKMSRKSQIEEGFAEFIADYLTTPHTLAAKTPGFFKAFETWLEQNPQYAASLQHVQDMIGAHQALTPEDRILAKVGAFKPTLGQRAGALVSKESWDTFAQATLDKWHPLKLMVADLAPGLAASKNPYIGARVMAGDAAVIEDWVTNFTSPYDYSKRLDTKNYGKSLKAILEPVLAGGEQELNRFKAYLIAKRAAELKKVGKENLFTAAEIAEGLKLETATFKQVAAEVYAYNDQLVQYAVDGGLLSPDVAAQFKQYASYIPFFRESDGDAKGSGKGDPFKKLTGGTANLRDPIANLIQNTANIIHATNRNAVLRKSVALAQAVPGGGRWLESVPAPQQVHAVATKRIVEELEAQGVVVDTTMAQNLAAMQTFFLPSGRGDDRTRTIVYKEGGELKAAQVNDPLLWKAVSNLPPLEMDLITKMLALPAQTLRAGVVLDPTFMVRNFVRDTLSATIQSKGSFVPVLGTAQGIKAMAQNSDAFKLWRSFGGAFGDQFHDPDQGAKIIERMAKRGGFDKLSIVSPVRLLDALSKIGAYTESGSRIGEFQATYKPGDFESALQAAFNSREVSTDFGMRGGNTTLQIWTRLVPFMNPALQGLYKTGRVLSGADGKGTAMKAAVLGAGMALASVMLAMANSDEDWYQRLEEWEKATYWHFRLAGQTWRIPKPFEYGMFFASLPEAIALVSAGKETAEDFKKRMLQVLSQVMIRVVPQIATALAEPWANKSFFTGRKIVPDRQEKLEPSLQANPSTSKVAQVAAQGMDKVADAVKAGTGGFIEGDFLKQSPAVIDNMVRNVFGTIGVHVETAADLLLEKTGTFPPGKERNWQSWPAIKAFVRDPDNPNTKQQRDFYETLEKYRTAVNSVRELKARGEEDKAEAYSISKSDELQHAKGAEKAAQRLAKIRKAVRSIEWDRDMTPAEKREAINEKNAEMQDIAAEQTLLYQAAKKSYIRPATEGAK